VDQRKERGVVRNRRTQNKNAKENQKKAIARGPKTGRKVERGKEQETKKLPTEKKETKRRDAEDQGHSNQKKNRLDLAGGGVKRQETGATKQPGSG